MLLKRKKRQKEKSLLQRAYNLNDNKGTSSHFHLPIHKSFTDSSKTLKHDPRHCSFLKADRHYMIQTYSRHLVFLLLRGWKQLSSFLWTYGKSICSCTKKQAPSGVAHVKCAKQIKPHYKPRTIKPQKSILSSRV